jgi:hypothetical protein
LNHSSYGPQSYCGNFHPSYPPIPQSPSSEYSVHSARFGSPDPSRLRIKIFSNDSNLISSAPFFDIRRRLPLGHTGQVLIPRELRDGSALAQPFHAALTLVKRCSPLSADCNQPIPSDSPSEVEALIRKLQGPSKAEEKARLMSLHGEPASRMLDECQTVSSFKTVD